MMFMSAGKSITTALNSAEMAWRVLAVAALIFAMAYCAMKSVPKAELSVGTTTLEWKSDTASWKGGW